jgi:hypothetical protein
MNARNLTLTGILLGALILRLYHLDFRALWWDEGLSLFFARLDYVANARLAVTLADTNPPIYRLLLGQWISLIGSSAWATRLCSVLPGVVLVAVIYRLANSLRLPQPIPLIATTLGAASPMLIYYAQEAKGYSWVALAGTASVLLIFSHPRLRSTNSGGPGWRHWGLWAFCLLLAIGSHYISIFLIAVENLWTLILTIHSWRGHERDWRTHWGWLIGAQLIVALGLLPFVLLTLGGTSAALRGETGEFNNLDAYGFVTQHILELTQGPTASGAWAWLAAGIVIGLVVIGCWRLDAQRWSRGELDARYCLVSWIAIPIILGFVLNSYHSFFFPRFVLYVMPPILILVANGIWQVANLVTNFALRALRYETRNKSGALIVLSSLTVLLWLPTLGFHYNTPTTEGEDWRPIAKTLQPLTRTGDAAIYTWGWIPGYLDSYLPPAPQPDYSLGFFTPESLDGDMQTIVAGHDRVWLLDYEIDQFDIRNMAGNWLRTRAALVYDDWPGGQKGHVALFALKPTISAVANSISEQFSNGLRFSTPEIQTTLRPGDALALEIMWQVAQPLTERYTIFIHGLAADGSLIFGRDSEPNNGASPVTNWQPDQIHTELRGVLIPPGTPAGRYTITLGIYQTTSGQVDTRGPVTVGAVVVK